MIQNIFSSHIQSKPTFKGNRDILRPSYIPEELPHREDYINDLASIMVTALRGNRPSNVLIFGKTGTGKTAVVRYLERELERLKEDSDSELDDTFDDYNVKNVEYVYINCEVVDTHYGVMKNIGNKFTHNWSEQIPFTGWPMEKVYEALKDRIDEEERVVVIILDELDKLISKSGDAVLYHLSKINSELKNSKVSLIGISNSLKFTEFLDPRVKSRLGEEKMIFPPYNADQLKDILSERVKRAFESESIMGDDVIALCAALAAQEHGDARRALDLLRISTEIAEREKCTQVTHNHVYKAKNKIEQDCVREAVMTLPTHSKLVMYSILLSSKNGNEKLTTGDVYSGYEELCAKSGMDSLTQRRIADLISELDMLGLIHARVKSFGRRGRTREIQASVPKIETIRTIEEDEAIVPVKELISLQTQMKLM